MYEVARFYDRDASISDWYYQMYATRDIKEELVRNHVAECVASRRIYGTVVIMKNGLTEGVLADNLEIRLDDLANTLWWYTATGMDARTVCCDRELPRLFPRS